MRDWIKQGALSSRVGHKESRMISMTLFNSLNARSDRAEDALRRPDEARS